MFLVLLDDQKQAAAFFFFGDLKPKLHLIGLLFIVAREI